MDLPGILSLATMTLTHILVFTAFALLVAWVIPKQWRGWIYLGSSILAVYWLQPSTPIRNLDFWLPTASIILTALVWAVTRRKEVDNLRSDLISALVVAGLILAIGLLRYLGPICCLTPTRPPDLWKIGIALGSTSAVIILLIWLQPGSRLIPFIAFLLLLGVLIIIKSESLAQEVSTWLRKYSGQDTSLANALDLRWLGYSYLAFRLLHALRDYQTGKLPSYSLDEFITYAIFFPAYTAGPIDRSQRFISNLRKTILPPETAKSFEVHGKRSLKEWVKIDQESFIWGGRRIILGVFKKFVLADSLALVALNSQNAAETTSSLWMWVLLYAYTLRIYLDFSGYTDVALGIGRLMGFNLPENFTKPYLKTNLTAFWNNWHITLTQWFRAYFFNPLTRSLRTTSRKLPMWAVILLSQVGTMLLIGLWHGMTWNFLAWGIWHGIGLFIHNRWSNWVRTHLGNLTIPSGVKPGLAIGGWFFTFHYVALGWVWFALPDLELAGSVFQRLAGI